MSYVEAFLNLIETGLLYGIGLVLGAFIGIVFIYLMLAVLSILIDVVLDYIKVWRRFL